MTRGTARAAQSIHDLSNPLRYLVNPRTVDPDLQLIELPQRCEDIRRESLQHVVPDVPWSTRVPKIENIIITGHEMRRRTPPSLVDDWKSTRLGVRYTKTVHAEVWCSAYLPGHAEGNTPDASSHKIQAQESTSLSQSTVLGKEGKFLEYGLSTHDRQSLSTWAVNERRLTQPKVYRSMRDLHASLWQSNQDLQVCQRPQTFERAHREGLKIVVC